MLKVIFQGHALTQTQIQAIAVLLAQPTLDLDAIGKALCDAGEPILEPVTDGIYRVGLPTGGEEWAKWTGKNWLKALPNLGIVIKRPALSIAWVGRQLAEADL